MSAPGLFTAASDWLKIEGAFADYRGQFDQWLPGAANLLRSVYPGRRAPTAR